jgi:hypothetical protein
MSESCKGEAEVELSVVSNEFTFHFSGDWFELMSLKVDDTIEEMEDGLWDDFKDTSHVVDEVCAVLVCNADIVGTVGLSDADEREVEDGGELEEGGAKEETCEGVILNLIVQQRSVVVDDRPGVGEVADDVQVTDHLTYTHGRRGRQVRSNLRMHARSVPMRGEVREVISDDALYTQRDGTQQSREVSQRQRRLCGRMCGACVWCLRGPLTLMLTVLTIFLK